MKFNPSTEGLKAIILTFALLICPFVGVFAQQERVTLPRMQMTGAEIFDEIQIQTPVTIGYDKTVFDASKSFTLSKARNTVQGIFDEMFRDLPVTYKFRGKFAFLSPAKAPAVRTTPAEKPSRTASRYVPSDPEQVYAAFRPRPASEPVAGQEPATEPAPMPESPAPYSAYTDPDIYRSIGGSLPRWAVKTNVLYAAAAFTPNLSVELATGRRNTVELTAAYNPWNRKGSYDDNQKLVHKLFQAEYRWWMCERFSGHFFGAHALFAHYNVGEKEVPLIFKKEYHYEGYAYGIGASYGYNLPIGKRWGLEFTLGIGAVYLNYDRFDCGKCGRPVDSTHKFYFGPTKLGVNLVFDFK